MPLVSASNPVPQVGQLLYKEYRDAASVFQHASLAFVDSEIQDETEWMYTEIALMEDTGRGMEVYNRFEAGGMPPAYTRLATDEDILKFVSLMKEGKISEGSSTLEEWVGEVEADGSLLSGEKERIKRLVGSAE